MDSAGWGVVAFWFLFAAIVLGAKWFETRQKAEKHETLRRIVEKTGTIDEARLKELFREDPAAEKVAGGGYRALRITGMIILFVGAGIATFLLVAAALGMLFGLSNMFRNVTGLIAGLAVAASIAMLGLGVFFSSRFAQRPPGAGNEPPAR